MVLRGRSAPIADHSFEEGRLMSRISPVHLRGTALVVCLAGLLAATGCAVPQPRGAGSLQRLTEPNTKRGYWLYLPQAYTKASAPERAERRWPLVVTFHGMKPFDNAHAQALEWEQEADRYGYVVVAPELRAPDVLAEFPVRSVHPAFKSDELTSLAIIEHVLATTGADRQNVLSTSWSSGGYMAHYMLNRHPDVFTCLAVRQSNFSSSVCDQGMASRSQFHPVLIVNTENDFAVCKEESREAVKWYERNNYKNIAWIHLKNYGHERTPDIAASFFALVAKVSPATPPKVLVKRQAINGNRDGMEFLSGARSTFVERPAGAPAYARSETTPRHDAGPRPQLTSPAPAPAQPVSATSSQQTSASLYDVRPAPTTVSSIPARAPEYLVGTPPRSTSSAPRPATPRSPLSIRVSSAIGIEPLHLGFTAECPAEWQSKADFHWTLNGQPIANGVNGQKTLLEPGEHVLGVLAVTSSGQEYRAQRTVRVLPRNGYSDTVTSGQN